MMKRNRQDRRRSKNSHFPLVDDRGNIVRAERRRQVDRRLGQIAAEWLQSMQDSGRHMFGK